MRKRFSANCATHCKIVTQPAKTSLVCHLRHLGRPPKVSHRDERILSAHAKVYADTLSDVTGIPLLQSLNLLPVRFLESVCFFNAKRSIRTSTTGSARQPSASAALPVRPTMQAPRFKPCAVNLQRLMLQVLRQLPPLLRYRQSDRTLLRQQPRCRALSPRQQRFALIFVNCVTISCTPLHALLKCDGRHLSILGSVRYFTHR